MMLLRRVATAAFLIIASNYCSNAKTISPLSTTQQYQTRKQRIKQNQINELPPTATLSTFKPIPSFLHHRGGGAITHNLAEDENYKISLSPLAIASIFAFLGGWSHALCNIKFDAFTAMVTGHIINMSVFLAEKQWKEAIWRMSIVGSYFGGVVSGRCIESKCEEGKKSNGESKSKDVKDQNADNQHFKIIAALVVIIFPLAEKLDKISVNLLTFGYGLIYPCVSASLGGTIIHLLTGHTTNVARLVGANQIGHRGMKTSVCIICSVVAGGVFGTNARRVLGGDFPFFTMLGFIYAAVLLLL